MEFEGLRIIILLSDESRKLSFADVNRTSPPPFFFYSYAYPKDKVIFDSNVIAIFLKFYLYV